MREYPLLIGFETGTCASAYYESKLESISGEYERCGGFEAVS